MSNETKIGILAVVSLAMLIWGFQFLKGKNILTRSTQLYAEYENVEMLQPSANIYINGLRVGVVSSIYLKPDDMKTIVVSMSMDRGISVPKSAKAIIISTGVMGGKAIELEFYGPCTDDCAQNGDYLEGRLQGFLESVVGNPEDLDPYIAKVKSGVIGILDTISKNITDPNSSSELAKSAREVQAIIHNLNETTANLNKFIAVSAKRMDGILANMASISGNIESGNEDIKNTLANMSTLSDQFKTMDLNTTLDKANATFDSATGAVDELKTTLKSTNKAINDLGVVVNKMKGGEGTMGKLLTDEELYTNLENSSKQLELLLQDFRLNPKRYTRILSKKQIEYEPPKQDPGESLGSN